MPPKKPAASRARTSTIKPLDSNIGFDELFGAHGVEEIATDMVQLIIDRGANILYGHYIQEKAEQITAIQAIDNVVNTVEYQLLPHDQGELLSYPEAELQRMLVPRDEDDGLN